MINVFELDTQTAGPNTISMQRLECLQRTLNSVDDWFRIFFSMPSAAYLELPFVVFRQLGRSTYSLSILSAVNDLGWDQDAVRQRLDLSEIMEKIASSLDKIQEMVVRKGGDEEDSLQKAAREVRQSKGAWEDEMRGNLLGSLAQTGDDHRVAGAWNNSMDLFLDDQWFTDAVISWES